MSTDVRATPAVATDRHLAITREIIETAFPSPRPFAVRLWDGSKLPPVPAGEPAFMLVINRPSALRRALLPPSELSGGESYLREDWDVEGDLFTAFRLLWPLLAWPRFRPSLAPLLLRLPSKDDDDVSMTRDRWNAQDQIRTKDHDRRAIAYHYNVSNDFFSLFLDQRMVYSCAYFPTGTETLDQAQEAKLDLICRKLRLKPGERMLDIGCGWGGLITYAVEHYGVEAVGITLSEPQAQHARRRITELGLEGRCRVEICHYRDVERLGEFDKISSVGMFEHVGISKLPSYFGAAWKVLKPGGLFMNHGIGYTHERSMIQRGLAPITNRWSFTLRYVFPNGELPSLETVIKAADGEGFEIRDVENLREHYVKTLLHWVANLEAHHDAAVRIGGETMFRVWQFYMAGSAYFFDIGSTSIYQVLLVKPTPNGHLDLPPTRAYLYQN